MPTPKLVARAIAENEATLPGVVLTEALSDPKLDHESRRVTLSLPVIRIHDEFWLRAGRLRADLKLQGLHTSTPDCLIAQSCLDEHISLITHDRGFRRFLPAGLKLAIHEE